MFKLKLNKLISMVTITTLLSGITMPVIANSTNEQNNLTNNENVIFDATIGEGHSYVASIAEDTTLDISLEVLNNGYIKEAVVILEENNYKLKGIDADTPLELLPDSIKSVKDVSNDKLRRTSIELNVNASDKSIKSKLPIELEKKDKISLEYFDKNSKVILNAIYVNKNGREEKITKTIEEHLEWRNEAEEIIEQEIKRYLKYEDKTIVTFKIKEGIKDNTIPVKNKTINVKVPELNTKSPSKVIVSGEGINYKYEENILTITKENVPDEKGNILWNSFDEYIVTYVYDTQAEKINIKTEAEVEVITANETSIKAKTENNDYEVKEEIGSLLETEIASINTLNKGYLYAKLTAGYEESYKINVGYSELLDEIKVKELKVTDEILNKKVSISKEELIDILGEEGTIKVYDSKDVELGTLNKDNTELEINSFAQKYVISKPIKEGNITIKVQKEINSNLNYTKEQIASLSEIKDSIRVEGILKENVVSSNVIEKSITLIEPTSNANIEISNNNLSTTVVNENVVITAILKRKTVEDAFYTNPTLKITLPSQVKEIRLKDARLIYEDGLAPDSFNVEGNVISLSLKGSQNEYTSIPTVDGTMVRIVADLVLDNLVPSANEKVTLDYTNEETKEEKQISADVNIVAPVGFITVNSAKIINEVTALNDDANLEIATNDKEKKITINGTIVSNLSETNSGVSILGRIPGKDTNSNSTFDTVLSSNINVHGKNSIVYYSSKSDATYDLNNVANGWTTESSDSARSYLIVINEEVNHGEKVTFDFDITTPSNLDYDNNAISNFVVYYDNKSENGENKNAVTSKNINILTDSIPIVTTQITASDYQTEDVINSGENVHAERLVKYTVSLTNTGKKAAQNVKVKLQKSEVSAFYIIEYIEEHNMYNNHFDYNNEIVRTIDNIEPGATRSIDIIVRMPYYMQGEEIKNVLRTEATADNMDQVSTGYFENSVIEGTLDLEINTISRTENKAKIGDEIEYLLTIRNNKMGSIKNVETVVKIPEFLRITESENGEYNERQRTITYRQDEVESVKAYRFKGIVDHSNEPNQEIILQATANFEEQDGEVKSNKEKVEILDDKGYEANLSTNIQKRMLDTDVIEYYLTIKNTTGKDAEVVMESNLPKELKLQKYIVRNGNSESKELDATTNFLSVNEVLKANETLRITMVANPYRLSAKGDVITVESSATVKVNGVEIQVNKTSTEIEGSSNFNATFEENEENTEKTLYKISGKVWYDANQDGVRDSNEDGIANVNLKLYNKLTGNELKATVTNEYGEYTFANLQNGQYIVVAEYNGKKYEITDYKKEGATETENSDFVQVKADNKMLATTDTIKVDSANTYNIDLGLRDAKIFNLSLNNKVSKIGIISATGKTYTYEFNEDLPKISLSKEELYGATAIVEYKIEIANKGNTEGYAKSVVDYIPEGMEFISELNSNWYINSKKEAINNKLENTLIKPGETKELTLVLRKEINDGNIGLVHNSAEIRESYNEYGIKEYSNSVEAREVKTGEIADAVISVNYAKEIILAVLVTIVTIAIIVVSGMYIKKSVNKYQPKDSI